MAKVKVVTGFYDAENNDTYRELGEVFDCTEKRAVYLQEKKVAEILEHDVENVDNYVDNKEENTENVDKPKRKRKKIEE